VNLTPVKALENHIVDPSPSSSSASSYTNLLVNRHSEDAADTWADTRAAPRQPIEYHQEAFFFFRLKYANRSVPRLNFASACQYFLPTNENRNFYLK